MRCSSCSGESPDGTRFCIECGSPLHRACARCGTQNLPRARFCGECAAPLGTDADAPASSPTPPSAPSLLSYTPGHLAEKILTSRSSLEGERKQVTVLFADLKGSMELLADRDPEEARRLLDPVLNHMMDAVHRYEGTVNQVMGDGIMALFGAPIAHEDHAVRACYAGLRMQESVRRYAAEVEGSHGARVSIRVGINAGEVVVRSIGSDLHMDYTAVGQTTHLAARMEQTAEPGSILITGYVAALAEGFIEVESRGPVPVKGVEGPVVVYELTGAGAARTRLEAAEARGLTRFVGRAAELESLERALSSAGAGAGQVVALVGDAGVGKSRLIREFLQTRRLPDWLVLRSSSTSYGRATPYLPLIDLLRGYFRIDVRDDGARVIDKVTATFEPVGEARYPTLPAVLALLDAPVDDPEWQALKPPQRRQYTLDAVKRIVLMESRAQPVMVIFEDLHWIDAETQAALDALVDSIPSARVLLLTNYRPDYQHGWGSKRHYTQLRLDALPPASSEELLDSLFGDDPALAPLKRTLIERTDGNPFFLEECVRTLVETGVLDGERGAYRPVAALPEVEVPATVQVLLAARIDRMPPDVKQLLQTAAVIGKDIPFPLLESIAELPDEELRRGCAHLLAAEFLYESSLFPELEYTFRHALTHEVAYRSLLIERRRTLHARIVAAIEDRPDDQAGERLDRLAHHAVRGEVWDRAARYCHEAGARAYARAAHGQAVEYIEQAIEALGRLPESRERSERGIDLRLDLHYALVPLGGLDRMLGQLREAQRLAEALADQRRLARVSSHLAHYSWLTSDHGGAIEAGEKALAIAAELDDAPLEAETNLNLGLAYRTTGRYRRALECFGRNVASLGGNPDPATWSAGGSLSVASSSYMVWCLADLGEFDEGLARGREGVRVAEAHDQREALIFAVRGLAYLELVRGELDQAIALLERGLDLCRDLPGFFPWMASTLGQAYALSGRTGEGVPLLEEAAQRPASGARVGHTARATNLAEAYLRAGRLSDAHARAREALEASRDHGERGQEAHAVRILAEIQAHPDSGPAAAAEAEAHFTRAMALAEELEMRPLLAHCRRGLGELYHRLGRPGQARAYAAAAADLYTDLGMTALLPR